MVYSIYTTNDYTTYYSGLSMNTLYLQVQYVTMVRCVWLVDIGMACQRYASMESGQKFVPLDLR